MRAVLGVILLVNYVTSSSLRIDPLVLIQQGLLRGQRATDGDYTTFLGIPYAVVDENNPFGASQPHTAFEEQIYRANDGSVKCPQTPVSNNTAPGGTETLDCLRLNIYVPNDATSINPLPVLVWIHGGGFSSGYAGEYGVQHLVNKGIVVVTVNYRLGPYGFMCLDAPSVPGNQGLKDQYTALRWIRNNIGSFGGNPYNVTLAGQGTGASSVLLHLYSTKEKLFHKVIAESGTPQNDGMFVNGDVKVAIKLANHLGYDTTDTEQALKFLAKTPYNLVTAATAELNLELKPCKEMSFSGIENFVETYPYNFSNQKKVSGTPVLIGHTSKEEINFMSSYYPNYFNSDPFYTKIAKNYNLNDDQLKRLANTIRHYYIGDNPISEKLFSEFGDFESDFIFNHPMQRTVTNLISENASPVYQYLFSYVGDSVAEGAAHSAELEYLFEIAGNARQKTEDDQIIADRITTLWTNFIKYGNPTPAFGNTFPVTWNRVTSSTRPYLVIDKDLRMEGRIFNERMAFWDLFHDNYGSYNKLARECYI